MIAYFYWDPRPEAFSLPFFDFPILWYGVFFAVGFWLGFYAFTRILADFLSYLPANHSILSKELRAKAHHVADRLTIYVVIGAIAGARLGHFLFYENPSEYLANPLELFLIRNGGLASHGAVIGIVIAAFCFGRKIQKTLPELTWIRILDFLAAPTALAGFWIRIGNFFNQEVLGKGTTLAWGIIFGHPIDHSFPVPRHPVQLYEAFWYMAVFILLWKLHKRVALILHPGRMLGLFLTLVFGFRFLVEFLKLEQSRLLPSFDLTMGQLLSIPIFFLGVILYARRGRESKAEI